MEPRETGHEATIETMENRVDSLVGMFGMEFIIFTIYYCNLRG